jgi:hypothetical protein
MRTRAGNEYQLSEMSNMTGASRTIPLENGNAGYTLDLIPSGKTWFITPELTVRQSDSIVTRSPELSEQPVLSWSFKVNEESFMINRTESSLILDESQFNSGEEDYASRLDEIMSHWNGIHIGCPKPDDLSGSSSVAFSTTEIEAMETYLFSKDAEPLMSDSVSQSLFNVVKRRMESVEQEVRDDLQDQDKDFSVCIVSEAERKSIQQLLIMSQGEA